MNGKYYLNHSANILVLACSNRAHKKARDGFGMGRLALQAKSSARAVQDAGKGDYAIVMEARDAVKLLDSELFVQNSVKQVVYAATVDTPVIGIENVLRKHDVNFTTYTLGVTNSGAVVFEKAVCDLLGATWTGANHTGEHNAYHPDGILPDGRTLECKSYRGVLACLGGRADWGDDDD